MKAKRRSVAIVNQAFQDHYFPHGNAIGRKIWLNGRDKAATEIVGEVSNGRTDDLTQESSPGDLSFVVAGIGVFETSRDLHGGGPTRGSGCRGTRAARRRSNWPPSKPRRLWDRFAMIRWRRTFAMQRSLGFRSGAACRRWSEFTARTFAFGGFEAT